MTSGSCVSPPSAVASMTAGDVRLDDPTERIEAELFGTPPAFCPARAVRPHRPVRCPAGPLRRRTRPRCRPRRSPLCPRGTPPSTPWRSAADHPRTGRCSGRRRVIVAASRQPADMFSHPVLRRHLPPSQSVNAARASAGRTATR
jgi:hypothetical protein